MYGSGGVRFDWAPDNSGTLDGAVSFIGTRWADDDGSGTCDRPVDGGIFRGAISIDGAGDVSFIQPTSPEIVVPLIADGTSAEEFDWAPDGLQVAYSRSEPGMWVATAAGTEQIYDESVLDLAWSPDLDLDTAGLQTLIAFHGWRFPQCGQASLTYVMETDGSGLTLVAGCESGRKSSTGHIAVDWSPTGTHLMETTTDDPWSIQIMAAGGSGQVTLVSGSRGTWVGNASAAP
jgi:hypothetical protein